MGLFREFHLQGLRSPKMRSLLVVNEQFSDKRNAANGTLWTDTNYKNAVDDKLMQGDKCTPEGSFKMISKYPHQAWSKFIWINYPNDDSWRKHNTAKREGRIPAEAKIGGEVGIHGVPDGMDFLIDTRVNWTLGCISLKNKDIDEVYPYVTNSTLIEIRK